MPYDITLSMLEYLFLSKVATLTQSNSLSAIFPHVHFCLTTGIYAVCFITWECVYDFRLDQNEEMVVLETCHRYATKKAATDSKVKGK